jgi:hypothetical protein
MAGDQHTEGMGTLLIALFLVLVGPLALAYGVDSRLDEPNRPW